MIMKLKILGIAQDGGVPQINCQCKNCKTSRTEGVPLFATSLLVERAKGKSTLIDVSPDIKNQLTPTEFNGIDSIVLTHAHVGHIGGLLQFGFEIANKKGVNLFASPEMHSFLQDNEPWKQLFENGNIVPCKFRFEETFALEELRVTPLKVPHRDEIADTSGFILEGDFKKVLFIPDIKNWLVWEKDLKEEVSK
ncbi:MBL fold metallo-hydrolase [candidate division WWE3 bacterium]|nr:MBL fold metallo-hydrolase [candidate division WWE3 bacterium]